MSLRSCWQSNLRANLHNPSSWSGEESVSLLYVPTGAGFCGAEQLAAFSSAFPATAHLFHESQLSRGDNELVSLSCVCDEASGNLSEELLLSWTQHSVKVPWLLPSHSFPLRRFELPFSIHAKICPKSKKLLSVRVYWDAALLLKQIDQKAENQLLPVREVTKRLTQPLTPALMNPLSALPGMKRSTSLNSLSSIIADLPEANELAVTPKMPARSRSINPALLSTMRLGVDEDDDDDASSGDGKQKITTLTDSPAPNHVRTVKSRVFDQEPQPYRPIMAAADKKTDHVVFDELNSSAPAYQPILAVKSNHFNESHVFDDSTPLPKTPSNMPQTDKVLFASRVFASNAPESGEASSVGVGNAQPVQPSHFMAPEEDLKLGVPEGPAATLMRPQMEGHFRGAQLGEVEAQPQRRPSNCYDPNKSQIDFTDSENAHPNHQQQLKGSASFNPNRSQIVFDFDEPQTMAVKPSSRVTAPPGGHSTIEL